jgi:hypothetical protein
MEARSLRSAQTFAVRSVIRRTLIGSLLVLAASPCLAAGYRTANFTVAAPTARLAQEIGDSAEAWRRSLAIEWLGHELPDWAEPCPIKARVAGRLGAGGATSFVFDQGEVFGWRMEIQGSRERVLDSVLPHEITHTIFASHFRQPLPRWADEGACTTVEHNSEIAKQERLLIECLQTRRGIPFSHMFAMKEYPQDVLPLYAQGHSLAQLLIDRRGKAAFLEFLADGMGDENWPRAIRQHYGYPNLLVLQNSWLQWIRDGRPSVAPEIATAVASRDVPNSIASSVSLAKTPATRPATASLASTELGPDGGWGAATASFDSPYRGGRATQAEIQAGFADAGPSGPVRGAGQRGEAFVDSPWTAAGRSQHAARDTGTLYR